MDKLQLKSFTLPPAAANNPLDTGITPLAAEPDAQGGFQALLQRLMGLNAAAEPAAFAVASDLPAAPDKAGDQDENVTAPVPTDMPGSALPAIAAAPVIIMPPAPAPTIAPGTTGELPDTPGPNREIAKEIGAGLATAKDASNRSENTTASAVPATAGDHPLRRELTLVPGLNSHAANTTAGSETNTADKVATRTPHLALASNAGNTLEPPSARTPDSRWEHALEAHARRAEIAAPDVPPANAAQGLRWMEAAPPAAAAAPPRIDTPLGAAGWDHEFSQKIVWLSGTRQHTAELHLNPPDLGPLNIKLSVDENQTSALFTSPHSEVREALESALPRLREVLADSGITLGNASVTSDSARDGAAFDQPQQRPPRAFGGSSDGDGGAEVNSQTLVPREMPRGRGNGLIDLFA